MITNNRKEVIRDMVEKSLNWMGSSFFHTFLTLETSEEAQYAASLWHHGSYDFKEPLIARFIP
jgi:hypothetical protein